MKLRHIAVTLTGIAAAAFLAASPAAAHDNYDAGTFAGTGSAHYDTSYENIGGPWGITRAHSDHHKQVAFAGNHAY